MAVDCDTYDINTRTFVEGRNSFKLSGVPYVDGSATYDEEKQVLSVALINYYQREEEVRLDLSGIEVKKRAVLNVLTGSAPDEMNDFDNPDRIRVQKKVLDNCSTEMFLKLDPMSANVIEFSLESGL
jgi:alpha-N-arabinofuranosidase